MALRCVGAPARAADSIQGVRRLGVWVVWRRTERTPTNPQITHSCAALVRARARAGGLLFFARWATLLPWSFRVNPRVFQKVIS